MNWMGGSRKRMNSKRVRSSRARQEAYFHSKQKKSKRVKRTVASGSKVTSHTNALFFDDSMPDSVYVDEERPVSQNPRLKFSSDLLLLRSNKPLKCRQSKMFSGQAYQTYGPNHNSAIGTNSTLCEGSAEIVVTPLTYEKRPQMRRHQKGSVAIRSLRYDAGPENIPDAAYFRGGPQAIIGSTLKTNDPGDQSSIFMNDHQSQSYETSRNSISISQNRFNSASNEDINHQYEYDSNEFTNNQYLVNDTLWSNDDNQINQSTSSIDTFHLNSDDSFGYNRHSNEVNKFGDISSSRPHFNKNNVMTRNNRIISSSRPHFNKNNVMTRNNRIQRNITNFTECRQNKEYSATEKPLYPTFHSESGTIPQHCDTVTIPNNKYIESPLYPKFSRTRAKIIDQDINSSNDFILSDMMKRQSKILAPQSHKYILRPLQDTFQRRKNINVYPTQSQSVLKHKWYGEARQSVSQSSVLHKNNNFLNENSNNGFSVDNDRLNDKDLSMHLNNVKGKSIIETKQKDTTQKSFQSKSNTQSIPQSTKLPDTQSIEVITIEKDDCKDIKADTITTSNIKSNGNSTINEVVDSNIVDTPSIITSKKYNGDYHSESQKKERHISFDDKENSLIYLSIIRKVALAELSLI